MNKPIVLTDEQMMELLERQNNPSAKKTLTDEEMMEIMNKPKGSSRSETVTTEVNKRASEEQFAELLKNVEEQKRTQEESPFAENISFWERAKRAGSSIIKSEKGFGESVAGAMLPWTKDYKDLEKSRDNLSKQQQAMLDYINAERAAGKDVTRLVNALKKSYDDTKGTTDFEVNPSINKTAKQVYGEAAGTAANVAAVGSLPRVAKYLAGAKNFGQGFVRGGVVGTVEGGIVGGVQMGGRAAQDNMSASEIGMESLKGLGIGAAGGFVGGSLLGGVSSSISTRINRSREIREALATSIDGVPGTGSAGYKKTAGFIMKDRTAERALKAGVSPDDVQLMVYTNPETKKVFKEMYNTSKFLSTHKTSTERASDYVGKEIVSRVNYIKEQQKLTGQEIGDYIKHHANKKVDVTDVYLNLVSELDKYGVKQEMQGVFDFSESIFRDNAKVQSMVSQLVEDLTPNTMTGNSVLTAGKIHRIRQIWFDNMNLAKAQTHITGNDKSVAIVNSVRSDLLDAMSTRLKGYKAMSTEYAKMTEALQDYQRMMGKDFDIYSTQLEKRAAEIYNRVLGNAPARATQTFDELEKIATSFGYKGKTNLRHLVLFSDFLEDLYPSTIPRRSLKGEVARGSKVAMESMSNISGIASDIANENAAGLFSRAAGSVAEVFKDSESVKMAAQRTMVEKLIGL
jgi:hypothetical protein